MAFNALACAAYQAGQGLRVWVLGFSGSSKPNHGKNVRIPSVSSSNPKNRPRNPRAHTNFEPTRTEGYPLNPKLQANFHAVWSQVSLGKRLMDIHKTEFGPTRRSEETLQPLNPSTPQPQNPSTPKTPNPKDLNPKALQPQNHKPPKPPKP